MTVKIEDLALIGDLHTAALLDNRGSIVWMCVPRFDSDTPFASLLGTPDNGEWSLRPVSPVKESRRRYREATLVIETVLTCDQGSVRLIDFMPHREEQPTVVRIVEGMSGCVEMTSVVACRFNFGELPPWARRIGDAITLTVGENGMALRTTVRSEIEGRDAVSRFAVSAGERVPFVLQWYASHLDPPGPYDAERALRETERVWREWSNECTYDGKYRDAVVRSLITLKALTYQPTGGCIAAPTTSLPEKLGGTLNWDYRYAWVRDSAFTVKALVQVGYREEARAWRDWLLRMLAGDPSKLQIAYTVTGGRHLQEWEVDWLDGYEGARPVRIGNGAYTQFQLGIYGEMIDAIATAHYAGIAVDEHAWEMLELVLDYVEKHWCDPDSGIWESRGKSKHHTNSRVMAWVAFDRVIGMMEKDALSGPIERYRRIRSEIADDVCRNGYKEKRKAFVQSYESDALDASVLLIPLMGFLPMEDRRVVNTLDTIEKELMVDGFILRESQDIRRPFGQRHVNEGAFLACNAWLVQNYAKAGRLQDANALFHRLLDVANDLDLLSEEYDVEEKRLVGNFPQTFSHATLINAALVLEAEQSKS